MDILKQYIHFLKYMRFDHTHGMNFKDFINCLYPHFVACISFEMQKSEKALLILCISFKVIATYLSKGDQLYFASLLQTVFTDSYPIYQNFHHLWT